MINEVLPEIYLYQKRSVFELWVLRLKIDMSNLSVVAEQSDVKSLA